MHANSRWTHVFIGLRSIASQTEIGNGIVDTRTTTLSNRSKETQISTCSSVLSMQHTVLMDDFLGRNFPLNKLPGHSTSMYLSVGYIR